MTWAGRDRALPAEMMPAKLFDRLFGGREAEWVTRKRSILDAVARRSRQLLNTLGKEDQNRLDEHLSSIRDLERAIASLPPRVSPRRPPEEDFDMKDWPRIAKSRAICWSTPWSGRRAWRAIC